MGKVSPSSLGANSPSSLSCLGRVRIRPWGTSLCSCLGHGKKTYTPSHFLLSMGSLCYSSALPPSLVPLLDDSSSGTWQGLAEMGEAEAWTGSSHSPCQSGYEELMQIKAYQPWGGQR